MNRLKSVAIAAVVAIMGLMAISGLFSMAKAEDSKEGPPQWFHLVGDEYFHIPVQEGWEVAWADPKSGKELVYIEFLPEGQELSKWEDMLTIQIFPRKEGVDGLNMINHIAYGFKEICDEHVQTPNIPGQERGISSFQGIFLSLFFLFEFFFVSVHTQFCGRHVSPFSA